MSCVADYDAVDASRLTSGPLKVGCKEDGPGTMATISLDLAALSTGRHNTFKFSDHCYLGACFSAP